MTEAQMRSTAASQIDLEINQSVAPIQSQITSTQNRETAALGQIGGMFDALQPVVQQGAQAVQQSYDQATAQERSVFANAQAELQTGRANRAADAQAMAQKIGGPVAIGDWTKPFDDAGMDLANLGAGQQLHTLAYAQAGEQLAQQFAGQVFPLVRTEQMAAARNTFEEQIREYTDQITALKAQKGAQVNKRYNELRTQELQYGLQLAQQNLDKLESQRAYNLEVKKEKTRKAEATRTYRLDKQQYALDNKKANRDYEVALRAAGQEDKRIAIADKAADLDTQKFAFQVDEAMGTHDGKKTLAAIAQDQQNKQAWAQLGLNKKEINAKIRDAIAARAAETKKLKTEQSTEWTTLMENAVNPQPGKQYSETEQREVSAVAAMSNPDAYYVPDGKGSNTGKWYVNVTTTHTAPAMQAITDPNRLVDYLVTAMHDPVNFPKSRAIELVKTRFPAFANWTYGEKFKVPDAAKKDATASNTGGGGGISSDPDKTFPVPDWMLVKPGAPFKPESDYSGYKIGDSWDAKKDPLDHYIGSSIMVTKSGAQVVKGKYTKVP